MDRYTLTIQLPVTTAPRLPRVAYVVAGIVVTLVAAAWIRCPWKSGPAQGAPGMTNMSH